MKIKFYGGPWHGEVRDYDRRPDVIGCKTDAERMGLHGVYRKSPSDSLAMVWKPLRQN